MKSGGRMGTQNYLLHFEFSKNQLLYLKKIFHSNYLKSRVTKHRLREFYILFPHKIEILNIYPVFKIINPIPQII